jgi:acetone carboxylase gamma subunit
MVVSMPMGTAVSCPKCGAQLAADGQDWKERALVERASAAERLGSGDFGPAFQLHEHDDLELAEFFCPRCETLVAVELYLHGEPTDWTFRSLAIAGSQGYDPAAEHEADPERWITFGVS